MELFLLSRDINNGGLFLQELPESGGEGGDDFEDVADNAVGGHIEDGGSGVFIDGDDDF